MRKLFCILIISFKQLSLDIIIGFILFLKIKRPANGFVEFSNSNERIFNKYAMCALFQISKPSAFIDFLTQDRFFLNCLGIWLLGRLNEYDLLKSG